MLISRLKKSYDNAGERRGLKLLEGNIVLYDTIKNSFSFPREIILGVSGWVLAPRFVVVGRGEWRPSKFTRIILTSEMFTRSRARTRATKCDDDDDEEESRAEFLGEGTGPPRNLRPGQLVRGV